MAGMRVFLVLTCALIGSTCAPSGGPPPDPEAPVGLLALDLSPLAAPLRADRDLPARVEVLLDGRNFGDVALPAPQGLLEGQIAIAVPAQQELTLQIVRHTARGRRDASATHPITVPRDVVLAIPVVPVGDPADAQGGGIELGESTTHDLPDATALFVHFRDPDRAPTVIERLPRRVAHGIAAILSDPQVQTIAPFTDQPSAADRVGSLVAIRPVPATRADAAPPVSRARCTPEAPARPVETDAPTRAETDLAASAAPTAPPTQSPPLDPAPTTDHDFVYYYSYCDCGEPVVDRAYALTLANGARLEGHTDRFGFVLHPGVGEGRIDFGDDQQPRRRGYDFDPDQPQDALPALLAALGSEIPNDRLIAMGDARRTQPEEARALLEELLEHPAEFTRLNAAITLSTYDDLRLLVRAWTHRLGMLSPDDPDFADTVAVLGALRHRDARPGLERALERAQPGERSVVRWALDFLAD